LYSCVDKSSTAKSSTIYRKQDHYSAPLQQQTIDQGSCSTPIDPSTSFVCEQQPFAEGQSTVLAPCDATIAAQKWRIDSIGKTGLGGDLLEEAKEVAVGGEGGDGDELYELDAKEGNTLDAKEGNTLDAKDDSDMDVRVPQYETLDIDDVGTTWAHSEEGSKTMSKTPGALRVDPYLCHPGGLYTNGKFKYEMRGNSKNNQLQIIALTPTDWLTASASYTRVQRDSDSTWASSTNQTASSYSLVNDSLAPGPPPLSSSKCKYGCNGYCPACCPKGSDTCKCPDPRGCCNQSPFSAYVITAIFDNGKVLNGTMDPASCSSIHWGAPKQKAPYPWSSVRYPWGAPCNDSDPMQIGWGVKTYPKTTRNPEYSTVTYSQYQPQKNDPRKTNLVYSGCLDRATPAINNIPIAVIYSCTNLNSQKWIKVSGL
jgi:hypothetical protein